MRQLSEWLVLAAKPAAINGYRDELETCRMWHVDGCLCESSKHVMWVVLR